ncbi:MAG TPA: DUF1295 domain-containing protein [Terrimicrobiaceae bacterium]
MNPWTLSAFGLNTAAVVMALGWLVARRVKNPGCLDVACSYGFAVVACLYAMIGLGDPARKWLLATMVILSSLQRGTFLLLEIIRQHPEERPRYVALREQFPKRPWLMFFGYSQYQAALIALLSVPFAIICSNSSSTLNGFEVAASLLWAAAICGEVAANIQALRFRSNPENSRKVCAQGLWRYSRHPQYLFEWLTWLAYFLFCLGSPSGWISIYCPLIVLCSLTRISGIPPDEKRSLEVFGDQYRLYQRTTSAFFPRPPRNDLETGRDQARDT